MEDEDDLTHYMNATGRMRERAERAEAERDRLQTSVEVANAAADAAAEAVGAMAAKTSALLAERDRRLADMDAVRLRLASMEEQHRSRAMTLASHGEQIAADEALMAAEGIGRTLDLLDGSPGATDG